jgi:hypothetical protein
MGPIRNRPSVVTSPDAEKAAFGAASIQGSFNSLLTADEESSRGSLDLRRHEIDFPHEPKWNAVTEFRVQAG